MARSYPPPQAAIGGYIHDPFSSFQSNDREVVQFPTSQFFCAGQYSDNLAFWHSSAHLQVQQSGFAALGHASSSSSAPPQQQQQQARGQKKHKRTRTGCYTCRSRRVKCDETLPICDRCRKGNRNCVYPGTASSTSKTGARSGAKSKEAARSSSGGSDVVSDYAEAEDSGGGVKTVVGGEEDGDEGTVAVSRSGPRETHSSRSIPRCGKKQTPSETARTYAENSVSPSTTESSMFDTLSPRSTSDGHGAQEPVGLPCNTQSLSDDLRFYLIFHQQFVTYHHYFMKPGSHRFIHQSVIDFALQYEPLLYAVVGFSAYLHSLHNHGGKLYTFLKYYHKALKLLRKSLGSGEGHSEATLITVLILTTFEEYIGDWVSLIDHHRAAHALMCELLTPESINLNEIYRHIFPWYARFDVVAGILAGNETILSREWYIAREEYDAEQAAEYPNDIEKQLLFAASINRRFGLDMASLYAKLSRGMISMEEFMVQNDQLSQTLESLRAILAQFDDSEYTITSYPHKKPLTEDDIVDPYLPGGLHQGPLWQINFAWIDYLSTALMFKYQTALTLRQPLSSELQSLALEQCRLIETIDRWPDKENGCFISFKNSLSIASMFLPKDEKHGMWCKRKFVQMEQNGYVYSPKFRAGLAALWKSPEMNHWWLPNDEGYPEVIREVRAMTEERLRKPCDDFREDVRNMKTVFWRMKLDDDAEGDRQSPSGTQ